MEMCNIPSLPHSLSASLTPSFAHTLSGQSMNHHFAMALSDIFAQDTLSFELQLPSLITIYLETPKDITAEIQIYSADGNYRRRASSADLNKDVDNFIKLTQFQHVNVV